MIARHIDMAAVIGAALSTFYIQRDLLSRISSNGTVNRCAAVTVGIAAVVNPCQNRIFAGVLLLHLIAAFRASAVGSALVRDAVLVRERAVQNVPFTECVRFNMLRCAAGAVTEMMLVCKAAVGRVVGAEQLILVVLGSCFAQIGEIVGMRQFFDVGMLHIAAGFAAAGLLTCFQLSGLPCCCPFIKDMCLLRALLLQSADALLPVFGRACGILIECMCMSCFDLRNGNVLRLAADFADLPPDARLLGGRSAVYEPRIVFMRVRMRLMGFTALADTDPCVRAVAEGYIFTVLVEHMMRPLHCCPALDAAVLIADNTVISDRFKTGIRMNCNEQRVGI